MKKPKPKKVEPKKGRSKYLGGFKIISSPLAPAYRKGKRSKRKGI